MFPYCCENVTGVDFECNKASAREGFLDSVRKINYFLGAFYYAGSCRWGESLLWLVLHQPEKLEVLKGTAFFNTVLAGKMWC